MRAMCSWAVGLNQHTALGWAYRRRDRDNRFGTASRRLNQSRISLSQASSWRDSVPESPSQAAVWNSPSSTWEAGLV